MRQEVDCGDLGHLLGTFIPVDYHQGDFIIKNKLHSWYGICGYLETGIFQITLKGLR